MPQEPATAHLLRLESELKALRQHVDGQLESIRAEVERRVSSSDTHAIAWSAVERRIGQLEESFAKGVERILAAVGEDPGDMGAG